MTNTITTATEARAYIREAIRINGKDAILDEVVRFNNTVDNDIDEDGDVWVCDPQVGHWLDDDKLVDFANFLAAN